MQEVTQRELRNDSGRMMRALDSGGSFIVTRNGVPVGQLSPSGAASSSLRRQRWRVSGSATC